MSRLWGKTLAVRNHANRLLITARNIQLSWMSCKDKCTWTKGSSAEIRVRDTASFATPHSDRDNVMQASFALRELMAKNLKPHAGEFVKETALPLRSN